MRYSGKPGLEAFANRLAELREHVYGTQREMAKQTGISRTQISAYEHGRTPPSDARLKELSNIFDVPVGYWRGEAGAVPARAAEAARRGFDGEWRDLDGLRERVRAQTGILVDVPTLLYVLRAGGAGGIGGGCISRAYAATDDDGATREAGPVAADADRGEAVARAGQVLDEAQADAVELVLRCLDGLPVIQRRALSDAEWAADRVALLRRAVGLVDDLRDSARGR